jgi:hypothetical protein
VRTITELTPARNYDAGGLVVERSWWVPPALLSFVMVQGGAK